jgi:RNA polymerase subunit RPABC4/transcription elongation factor Spt4
MNCSTCGNQINEDAKFCKNCGVAVVSEPVKVFCKNCGNQIKESAQFCNNCGEAVVETQHAPSLPPPPVFPEKKRVALKYVLIGVALLVALGVGLYLFTGKGADEKASKMEMERVTAKVDAPSGLHINMHAGPSTNDDILLRLNAGTVVWVFPNERSGQWAKIEYNNMIGYVDDKFLEYSGERDAAKDNTWLIGNWEEIEYAEMAPADLEFKLDGTFHIQYIRSTAEGTYTVKNEMVLLKGKYYCVVPDENDNMIDKVSEFSERLTIKNKTLENWRKSEAKEIETIKTKGPSSGTYTVRTKTFFHNEPNASTVRRAYLIEGDKVYVEKTENDFGYVSFTNTKGTVTTGWLKMGDLDLSK